MNRSNIINSNKLKDLRAYLCRQSPSERLATATALLALLDPASESHGGKEAVDAFLRAGGPSILRYRLDSMDGSSACGILLVVCLTRVSYRAHAHA